MKIYFLVSVIHTSIIINLYSIISSLSIYVCIYIYIERERERERETDRQTERERERERERETEREREGWVQVKQCNTSIFFFN